MLIDRNKLLEIEMLYMNSVVLLGVRSRASSDVRKGSSHTTFLRDSIGHFIKIICAHTSTAFETNQNTCTACSATIFTIVILANGIDTNCRQISHC